MSKLPLRLRIWVVAPALGGDLQDRTGSIAEGGAAAEDEHRRHW